ncbi:MAG: type II toxin-antitoxin system RelE/ParE family toxin [Spirochaetaceae bacterium]|jgi:hypothetical protein|nr:type II toxin-antitoxin system RelE/ParE family toxin [Spirochaetaceae bacterium]
MRVFKYRWFAKSSRDNISEKEERYYKKNAKKYLAYSDDTLDAYKAAGGLIEI